jgi:hypothetical protein
MQAKEELKGALDDVQVMARRQQEALMNQVNVMSLSTLVSKH